MTDVELNTRAREEQKAEVRHMHTHKQRQTNSSRTLFDFKWSTWPIRGPFDMNIVYCANVVYLSYQSWPINLTRNCMLDDVTVRFCEVVWLRCDLRLHSSQSTEFYRLMALVSGRYLAAGSIPNRRTTPIEIEK